MTSFTYEPMLVSDVPVVAQSRTSRESVLTAWTLKAKQWRLERRSRLSFEQCVAMSGGGRGLAPDV